MGSITIKRDLIEAIRANNCEMVLTLFDLHLINLNELFKEDIYSSIDLAILNNDIRMIDLLISHGVSLDPQAYFKKILFYLLVPLGCM